MKFFDRLKLLSTNDARKELLKIMGIGRKVKQNKTTQKINE